MNRWILFGFIVLLATFGGDSRLAFPLVFYLALFKPLYIPPFSLIALGIGVDVILGKEIWGTTSLEFLLLYIFAMKPRIHLSQLPFPLLWAYFGVTVALTWGFEAILYWCRGLPPPSPILWIFSISIYPIFSWGADLLLRISGKNLQ